MRRWSDVHDIDDEERHLEDVAQEKDCPPPGWRPDRDTIKAIENPGGGDWVDSGIHEVPIHEVDMSEVEHVESTADFHKVSYEEMVEGYSKLDAVVKPAVAKGAGSEQLGEVDRAQGLDYEHGYQRVYDAFYGDSSIRLEKDAGSYRVVNGAHRLVVARDLGLDHVPARVIERRQRTDE
jgi:hypothetical protein